MIRRIFLVLISFATMLSVGGVFATWQYAEESPEEVTLEVGIRVGEFNWAGSGDLPVDGDIGEDHIALINQILNHTEHGLNAGNRSYLNEQIADRQDGGLGWSGRDTLGSMAVTQSDELEEIFGLAASKLTFLLYFESDSVYYLFTTNVYLGERGEVNILGYNRKPGNPTVPIGEEIYPIYRTKLVKTDGTWAAVETQLGHATSAWYEESRRNSNATQIPSFDPDTFVEGEPS